MAFTIPTTEPDSLIAGESWKWTKDLSDFPSSIWTLTYYFVLGSSTADENKFTIVSTDTNSVHTVNIDEATTLPYAPGLYYYQGIVTDGSDVHVVITGQTMTVVQDFSDGSVTDPRSWACISLDALESSLAGTASSTQLAYTIDGIQVSEMSPSQKLSWLEGLRRICAGEQEQNNINNGRGNNRVGRYKFTPLS